ncbi:hypothetical protein AVEN_20586-1 [Araneus ventricosus]|uniref:Uncharacterized protein n=1 Tax=Araneus ventricosus TaxID=182803 RepID=A0A4Y2EJB1_ARAVE|nr:hypothetical protein AVEN_20586-1 [Araneus ventricosus]
MGFRTCNLLVPKSRPYHKATEAQYSLQSTSAAIKADDDIGKTVNVGEIVSNRGNLRRIGNKRRCCFRREKKSTPSPNTEREEMHKDLRVDVPSLGR